MRRFLKRYLRSNFGLTRKVTKDIQKRKNNFDEWMRKYLASHRQVTPVDVQKQYRNFRYYLDDERNKKNYVEKVLSSIETELLVIRNAIYISFGLLHDVKGVEFSIHEFALKVIDLIEPAMKQLNLMMNAVELKLRRESSLDFESNLLNLSASIANELSINRNQRLAKSLGVEPKPVLDTLLDRIPGSVLIALYHGEDRSNLTNQVAELLSVELPLGIKHDQRRQRQLRDIRKQFKR